MAEKTVADAFASFDAQFAAIQPGEVKKMNEAIATLTKVQGSLVEVGNNDPNKGNELAKGFNDRMKKLEDLSKVPAPKPEPKTIVAQPQKAQSVKKPAYEVPLEVEAVPEQPAPAPAPAPAPVGEEPIPADIEAALTQFDVIEKKIGAITKMDVWTGNANNTVNEWNEWQNKYAQKFVNLVAQKAHRNARLKAYGDKYNALGNTLRDKIINYQITPAQKEALNRVQPEYEAIVSEFRSTYSEAALKKMEALDRSIRALGIPDHPSVVGALQSFEHSLGQMRNMVKK